VKKPELAGGGGGFLFFLLKFRWRRAAFLVTDGIQKSTPE
jgi:hypothetical protein